MKENALIILIRNPILGCVKTRLAADIGDARALEVYNKLLKYTCSITREVQCSRMLFYSEFIDENDNWAADNFTKFLQVGNSFGERMRQAFEVALENHAKAVIIGSDCNELTTEIIREAFNQLDEYDVTLGPAKDGGYYLMGLKKIYPELFMNKQWSTSMVLSDTINDINRLGLSLFLLPILSDIDNFDDLKNSRIFERSC